MKYLMIGAGAIGTYVGASLLDGGSEVAFLEKAAYAPALRQSGVRLKVFTREIHFSDVTVFDTPESAFESEFDVVVFAMKSFDTQIAAESLAPFQKKINTILCLQNGVENEQLIQSVLPDLSVTAGSVTSAVSREGVGHVALEKMRGIGIENGTPLSANIYSDFLKAGLNPKLYSSRPDMKWSKMLSNLLGNASCAILDQTPAHVFADPDLFHLEMCQMREALDVMKAYGWNAIDLPSTPIGLLCKLIQVLPEGILRPALARILGSGRGKKMPSFHIDLHSGSQRSEVEFLNGAVSRYGIQRGIPTPVNDTLTEILIRLVEHPEQISDFRQRKDILLQMINREGKSGEAN